LSLRQIFFNALTRDKFLKDVNVLGDMKDIGYIVPHTHWDREWRYPIWQSRMLLVEFMEELLGILDSDPKYRSFVLDGQSVIIEDYLEVRPGNKDKVAKYIKEGRISIGPWYTLPDLYPIEGKA
jgi:mannosylglycerate hydrolase